MSETESNSFRGETPSKGRRRRLWKWWVAGTSTVVAVLLLVVVYAAFRFLPERPVTYDSMEEHFKYGSTRGDLLTGIPVWIWHAMPLACTDALVAVAGDRLAGDYSDRVARYSGDEAGAAERLALSREGYKALGFLYEQDPNGRERVLPVGTSERRSVGLDRTYINCAVCHTSTVRESDSGPGTLMIGMPANLFNLYDFEHFTFQCAKHRRFNPLELIPEIQSLGADLDLVDRYLVYPIAVWAVRDAFQILENQAGFSVRQPEWGPGRNDTFTNNKVFLFGEPWRQTMPDWWETGRVDPKNLGIVDFPSIWLQGPRKVRSDGRPMQLHWDGNNDMVEERNLNASLATSAIPPIIDHEAIECIEQWLETLAPPAYPFPIDQALAARGAPVYQHYCAECHGRSGRDFTGEKVGFVTPIQEIATDRHRLDNYTEALALNMATTYAGQTRERRSHSCPGGGTYTPPAPPSGPTGEGPAGRLAAVEAEEGSYRYKHYRKTNGYANMPLDGLWLRAPYLHNGSVPTLRDLLKPADERPEEFHRGNDLYDPRDVGFVSTQAQDSAGRSFFPFDTRIPGNGNRGHQGREYGTELSPEAKEALLEYLKTF
jgi:hypothetical protein